jgi:drug/metabolite transporter (DMT)-like permease
MLTSQSAASLIVAGVALIVLSIVGGSSFDAIALGGLLLLGAGVSETTGNRRTAR